MTACRPIIAFTVASVLAGASSRAVAQAGTDHSKHRMGPEIVIPKGAFYTKADVEFMQGMIAHHAQAVDMVDLIEARTARDEIRMLGRRIAASQVDEITMMQDWLKSRSQPAPETHTHEGHVTALMPGMLTGEEMARLAASRGADFDRLFLEGMIKHHGGALTMVEQLFSTPGAGQEVEVFTFASDVDADQRIEIDRMAAMLDGVLKELQR